VGATPQDLVSILQAMKTSGALKADLQIIWHKLIGTPLFMEFWWAIPWVSPLFFVALASWP